MVVRQSWWCNDDNIIHNDNNNNVVYYIEKVTDDGGGDVVVCNTENEFNENIVAGGGKGRHGKAETTRFIIIIRASSHPSTRQPDG